jgi:hypothetical protein
VQRKFTEYETSSDAGWVAVICKPLGETAAAVAVDALCGLGAGRLHTRVAGCRKASNRRGSRKASTYIATADVARSQKCKITCAEVRESLNALAGADSRDFRGREVEEVLRTDVEVDAAGGRAVRGGDLEDRWCLAAFERLEDFNLVQDLAILTKLGLLRHHECAHNARVFRLEKLRFDRGKHALAAYGGRDEGEKGQRQEGDLHVRGGMPPYERLQRGRLVWEDCSYDWSPRDHEGVITGVAIKVM